MHSHASSSRSKSDRHSKQGYDGDHVLIDNTEVPYVCSPSDLKDHNQEVIKNVSGGSSWENLLGGSSITIDNSVGDTYQKKDNSVGDQRQSLSAMFEIPLDFIIEKCLLQEIILQYPFLYSIFQTNINQTMSCGLFIFSLYFSLVILGIGPNQKCDVYTF